MPDGPPAAQKRSDNLMRDNPVHSFLQFMAGQSGDAINAGVFRWPAMMLWWLLLIAGVAVAAYNLQRDPEQRSIRHIAVCALRFVGGGFWFAGSLWKLPLPVSQGFRSWMEMCVKYSSYQWHSDFMGLFLGYISIVGPLVYLLEITFCASLMLGFMVRPSNIVSSLFIVNLLIGLFNDPTEWVWTYVGLIISFAMFATTQAGRSLGIDNLLVKRLLPLAEHDAPLVRFVRWAA
jgi:uncharacterized membrane protein YphA (DoxX/SURF4 family)